MKFFRVTLYGAIPVLPSSSSAVGSSGGAPSSQEEGGSEKQRRLHIENKYQSPFIIYE
jgi:hypothetical protein